MVSSFPGEQRFDFGDEETAAPGDGRDAADVAKELLARLDALHAVATRKGAPPDPPEAEDQEEADVVSTVITRHLFPGVDDDQGEGSSDPGGSLPRATETEVVAVAVERDGAGEFPLGEAERDDDEPRAAERESLTVAEFYERVRFALQQEFTDEVWVTGEIRGLRTSRGHRYLELADAGAENSGRSAAQQLEVVCWSREWPVVAAALAEAGVELEVGRVVRVRGRVSVWEGGSKLRFTLTALDVEALLGGIAAARRRLLLALEREGLLDANRRRAVAVVPLRIGVVTSPGSEAHRDFVGQLQRSGFAFAIRLEASLVQGAEAPAQLVRALDRLAGFEPDLVVIVRGGGARGDLAAFDSEEVARAIALANFPVWSGIGHTGDRSVADEVVHSAWITPTACGEAVVARVRGYWEDLERRVGILVGLASSRLDSAGHFLSAAEATLTSATRHQLDRHGAELVRRRDGIARGVRARTTAEAERTVNRAAALGAVTARAVARHESQVAGHRQVLRAYDPRLQFERGWSLTRDNKGELVRSTTSLSPGSRIVTRFADGEATSVLEDVRTTARPQQEGDGR
jgi:exodeoxyribonuclease VII large subunit